MVMVLVPQLFFFRKCVGMSRVLGPLAGVRIGRRTVRGVAVLPFTCLSLAAASLHARTKASKISSSTFDRWIGYRGRQALRTATAVLSL